MIELNVIATNQYSAKDSRDILLRAVKDGQAEAVYAALLRWSWVATSTRTDPESLIPWHALITEIQEGLRQEHPLLCVKVGVIADLIAVSFPLRAFPTSRTEGWPMFDVLKCLCVTPSGMSPRTIADTLRLPLASIAQHIAFCKTAGWVEVVDETRTLRMTEKGHKQLYQALVDTTPDDQDPMLSEILRVSARSRNVDA